MRSSFVRSRSFTSLALAVTCLVALGCSRKSEPPQKSESEVGAERSKPPPEAAPEAGARHLTAVKAAIWGTPIVSFDAMRQAYFKDAGAKYNDIVYWSKPADWKNQTATPNATTNYVYVNFNTKKGPVVIEVPPATGAGAGLFGSVLDAWQVPRVDVGPEGTDAGKGGKYLLIPPGYQGENPSGYLPVRFETFNGYLLFRAIPEDQTAAASERAIALIKKIRVHPLDMASKAQQDQRFIDMSGKLFDGIVRYEESYFTSLARMVTEEPAHPRDAAMFEALKTLGIEKDKPFVSTPELGKAAHEVHTSYVVRLPEHGEQHWSDRKWRTPSPVGLRTGFSFVTNGVLDAETRGITYFLGYAPPMKTGKASFYLMAYLDGAGQLLSGGTSYVLRVPAKVPAKQFWSVTVYDSSTSAFVRESPRVEVSSFNLESKNADGSVDVHFGPKAPSGKKANWIYTEPNKRWFAFFRFYGPESSVLDKSFKLDDIQRVE